MTTNWKEWMAKTGQTLDSYALVIRIGKNKEKGGYELIVTPVPHAPHAPELAPVMYRGTLDEITDALSGAADDLPGQIGEVGARFEQWQAAFPAKAPEKKAAKEEKPKAAPVMPAAEAPAHAVPTPAPPAPEPVAVVDDFPSLDLPEAPKEKTKDEQCYDECAAILQSIKDKSLNNSAIAKAWKDFVGMMNQDKANGVIFSEQTKKMASNTYEAVKQALANG